MLIVGIKKSHCLIGKDAPCRFPLSNMFCRLEDVNLHSHVGMGIWPKLGQFVDSFQQLLALGVVGLCSDTNFLVCKPSSKL
eukprot:523820-Amphidinium_carterae.3